MHVFSRLFSSRSEALPSRRSLNTRLILLFAVLTMVLTGSVILLWEQLLRPPFYHWVERNYPGPQNALTRDRIEQRTEHFFISMTVDMVVVTILLVIVDRNQRRLAEAQEQLARNERIATLGRVAAQVAHEVRNPLAGLLLYSEHLKGRLDGKIAPGDAQLVDKIIATINNLTATTEQILNYARPLTMTPKNVDLNEVVPDIVQLLSSEITAHNVETKLELNSSPVTGLLDEASIRAATLNLVLNAVQAMSSGGQLSISTRKTGDKLCMVIKDTGPGMSPERIRQIFEPFNTTKSRGLGLGMPYAQKIIQQHGGKISVESEIGKGTEVKIELPASGNSN